jgi:hypothetical protein
MGIRNNSLASRFKADKLMIEHLDHALENNPDEIAALNQQMTDYQDILNKYHFRDWVIEKRRFTLPALLAGSLLLILAFPVFAYGYLTNIVPYSIPVRIARKKIKDPQMHSTFKFVLGMVFFPLMYLLLMIPGFIILENGWLRLAFILSLPLCGMAAYFYFIQFKKNRSRFRFFSMRLTRNPAIQKLINGRNTIFEKMNQITSIKTSHDDQR